MAATELVLSATVQSAVPAPRAPSPMLTVASVEPPSSAVVVVQTITTPSEVPLSDGVASPALESEPPTNVVPPLTSR